MKRSNPLFLALAAFAAGTLAGCAGAPQAGADERTAAVKVYAPAELSSSEYDVVRQLWVDSWSTAVWMPAYASEADGIAALQAEAGRSGADGLINVYCVDRGRSIWSSNSAPALVCYANAIRVKQSKS